MAGWNIRQNPSLVLAVLLSPIIPGCNGCSETNIVGKGPVGVDTGGDPVFDHDWGQWLSMGVTAEGEPAVAYYDRTKGGLGFAIATIKDDGTVKWKHEEGDGFADENGLDAGDRGKYASMRIAADGGVWVAHQDVTNKGLRWAYRTKDGEWTNGLADAGSGAVPNAGMFAALALDEYGSPVIAHYDAANGNLRIAHFNASTISFSPTVVDEGEAVPAEDSGSEDIAADVGRYAAIEIVAGIEYILYYDAALGDLKLAYGTAGNYTVEVVDSEGDVGAWPNFMVVDGTMHIAYQDVGNQDLKYAVGAPGSWAIEVVDEGAYVGADTEIFMNGSVPSIAYFDGFNNDMKLARQSSDGWLLDTVTGADAAQGFHNEVVLAGGNYYAACYDWTNRTLWFDTLQ